MAIPENMEEINQELGRQAAAGNQITERTLILQTVQQLLQQYLIAAEEGFYDTVTLADDRTLIFSSVTGKQLGTYQARGIDLVADFKADALQLRLDLETAAQQIAGGR